MIHSIAQLIAEKVGSKDWKTEVLLAPMGYDPIASKFTLAFKAPNFSRKFIVKVSSSTNLNDLIRHEAEIIASLADMGVQGIPQIILHGMQDGRYFMAQEFIMGTKLVFSEGAFDATYNLAKDWLLALSSKTAGRPLDTGEILNRAKSFNAIISEFFPLSESIYHMEKLAPTCEIPTSWVHGDFCHGNLIIDSNNKMWVTDFSILCPRRTSH